MNNEEIKLGLYEHFKGGKYEVIGFAQHSETLEKMVLYKHFGEEALWVRPQSMFLKTVERDGVMKPRFKYLGVK